MVLILRYQVASRIFSKTQNDSVKQNLERIIEYVHRKILILIDLKT